jgi:acetyltransferase-like isoleucine patch superfamily enzyme
MPAAPKSFLKKIYHTVFHPGVDIGQGAFVDRRAQVDRAVRIGAGSTVFHAAVLGKTELGANCIVGDGSRVGHSRFAANVGLDAHVEVYNSTIDENVRVQTRCQLTEVRLGRYSYVARETILNDVTLGSFVSIGPRCLLGLGDHPANLPTTCPAFYSARGQCGASFAEKTTVAERKTIHIGHDVWLGAQVFVRDGVTIGDGAIVAAGSVVAKDVPPYAIVGGVPAKVLRSRFAPDEVKRLLAVQWWRWDEARLRANQPWFAQSDIAAFLRRAEA